MMKPFDVSWTLVGRSRIMADSAEDAIKRIELLDTPFLVQPAVTPNPEFTIDEVGEVLDE